MWEMEVDVEGQTDAGEYHDVSLSPCSHCRQHGFYDVHWAEEVGFELFADEGEGSRGGGELFDCAYDGCKGVELVMP